MLNIVFSYGGEPVLIHQILLGFEWIREKKLNKQRNKRKNEKKLNKQDSF